MLSKTKKIFSPYEEIIGRVSEAIGIQRIKMTEVAVELEVTKAAVSDFQKKDYIPAETMLRWCKKRGVSVDWVLGNEKGQNIPNAINHSEEVEMLKDELIAQMKKHQILGDKYTAALEELAELKYLAGLKLGKQKPLARKKMGQ